MMKTSYYLICLGGLDTTYYSNRDVERGEVYIEMVHIFDDEKSMAWRYPLELTEKF